MFVMRCFVTLYSAYNLYMDLEFYAFAFVCVFVINGNIKFGMMPVVDHVQALAQVHWSLTVYSVSQKKSSPVTCGFLTFFHKRLRILNQFLHTYYTTLSTLDYKFLLSYLKF